MQGHISPFLSTWCPRHVYKMSFPDTRMTWGIQLWNRRDWWFWMAPPKNSKRVLSGIVVAESSFSEVDFTSTSSVEFCHFLGDLWSKHIPYLQEIWTHMAKCHMYKRWLDDQLNESHQANLWVFVLGAPSHQTKHLSPTAFLTDLVCLSYRHFCFFGHAQPYSSLSFKHQPCVWLLQSYKSPIPLPDQ